MFSKELNAKLDEYHLLKHPFYQAWNEGKLSKYYIYVDFLCFLNIIKISTNQKG